MAIEIRVPALGESVSEATVGQWFKKPGDAVKADEPLVELETDKVTVEVPAPAGGVLGEIAVAAGETVAVGAILGHVRDGAAGAASTAPAAAAPAKEAPLKQTEDATEAPKAVKAESAGNAKPEPAGGGMPPSPAARKAMDEAGVDAGDVQGSGKRGQILKEDVAAAVEKGQQSHASAAPSAQSTASQAVAYAAAPAPVPLQQMRAPSVTSDAAREERVKMTRLRQTIARRLKDAQNSAAMLTTFNDVDMSAVMAMRSQYKDLFEKRFGVKLGFMGF
ncbi:MAG: E3 binding domain-containing protein, partial [Hyphomicrobiaceae bacterium]|nr:E3 binding domain-containing protein [Hyphomicrobiaceae bacterium]